MKKDEIHIVNFTTGEVGPEGYTWTNAKQKDAFKRKQEARGKDFTASNMNTLVEVYEALTTAQCGYLMRLQCNVDYNDGLLVNNDRNKTPMTTIDMMHELDLDAKRKTFYDFFNACKTHGIIHENDNRTYSVNTRYHFKGAFEGQRVVKIYTKLFKEAYREVKATDLGLIYRMLPYVHYESNALCKNPHEEDPNKVEWFTVQELAEAIGVTRETLTRRIPKMTFAGQYVIARTKVGREPAKLSFNPYVLYRRDNTPDIHLRTVFQSKM